MKMTILRASSGGGRPARPNLVEQVTEQLRGRILQGQYAVGQTMPSEGKLAEGLGVSRTVIREAMRGLRAQGLVEVSQGRRPRVKSNDPSALVASLDLLLQRSQATILHLIQIRRPLEGEIAALAARLADDQVHERLARSINEMRLADDVDGIVRADVAFHRCLAEASGNPLFVLFLDTVRTLLVRSQKTIFPLAGLLVTLEGHQKIYNEIRAGQVEAARAAMLRHLDEAEQALRRAEPENIQANMV